MADEDPEPVPEPKPMPKPAKNRSAEKNKKTRSAIAALAMGARVRTMTDEEYLQWLDALARKHLQFGRLEELRSKRGVYLAEQIDRLSSIARLANALAGRPAGSEVEALVNGIRKSDVRGVMDALDYTGLLAALDEQPEVTFGQLRRSAIPDQDVELLQGSGISDPEAEIAIIINHARQRFGRWDAPALQAVADGAEPALHRAADVLAAEPQEGMKKRKLLNGIGKILGGTITAAGNVLLATGMVTFGPGLAAAAIASSGLAISGISQGIGDLRGE